MHGYKHIATDNGTIHASLQMATRQISVFCGCVRPQLPAEEMAEVVHVCVCVCSCECVLYRNGLFHSAQTTNKVLCKATLAIARSVCWLYVGTFFLVCPLVCWSKNQSVHTEATTSKAPSVPIEHVRGNKYYILLPQETVCLYIFALFMGK